MSLREKTAWISLLSMVVIYGIYFWSLSHAPSVFGGTPLAGILLTTIALAVAQVVLTIVVAIRRPREAGAARDEREKLIDLRSARIAYAALLSGIVLACCLAAFNPPILFGTNALLFLLVAAEVLRSACQIVQYRRAA